jgi:hypothetical protein
MICDDVDSMQMLFSKLWGLEVIGIPDKDRRFASNKVKCFASSNIYVVILCHTPL